MSQRIEPKEWKVLGGIAVFAIFWIVVFVPFITANPIFTSQIPPVQYITMSLGFMLLSIVVFGPSLALKLDGDFTWPNAIKSGLLIWFSFSFAIDMWQPPFAIDMQGNQIISGDSTGINASVDRMWAYIFDLLSPGIKATHIPIIDVSFLYIAVYALVPLITAFIAAYALSHGEFIKWFNGGSNA